MQPLPIFKKWMFYPLIILVVLGIATPVLADYLGPNRTVAETTSACQVVLYECQYVAVKGSYHEKRVEDWSCSNESKPWQAYPSSAPSCNATNNGRLHWEREETLQSVTVTYPPATINSSLQNCTPQNGWCTTIPQLSLSGNEPVAGFSIYAIEGSLNGQQFACMNSNCSVPLNQGSNSLAFWALSSFGDSSSMEVLSANVDSEPPSVTGAFTGTAGSNGWYTSPVSFSGSASDAVSGLASFTCVLDGVALGACNPFTVTSNGLHNLVLTARDNAGHTRTLTQNVSIDTRNPVLNALISGTLGSNNWYTNAILNASAADPSPGSGLSTFEYSVDSNAWAPFPASGALALIDGRHRVDLRALDNAGHMVLSSRSFWLDTVAPGITLESAGINGLNDWFTTSPTLTASAKDSTSGLELFEYSLDNAAWQPYTTSLTLSDGIHTLSLWAQDYAGLVTQVDRTYRVDTRVPQIAGSLSGTPGSNGWYVSEVILSASASDPAPGSGMDRFVYILDDHAETPYINPLTLSDGRYTVQLHATDKAGLSYSMEQNIKVDTKQPSLKVETTFPTWIRDDILLKGTAADDGSGLSRVEISVDSGQTWQAAVGTDSWTYNWNTLNRPNGVQQVYVRVFDHAGLNAQQTFRVGVDNTAPEIRLPDSWFQWDTITLDVWDSHSGLSEARVEIMDPEGRWPKRVIDLNPRQFPLSFKWDRRFGNGIVAPLGIYEVKVIASDGLENTSLEKASIKILLDALPAGPTSTPQSYIRVEPTATPIYAAAPIASPEATQPAVISAFGVIEPIVQATPTVWTLPDSRVAPTQTSVLDWLQSFFLPVTDEERVTEFGAPEESNESSQSAGTDNIPVLWGAAAAAAIGAATASALEERRRRDEELARQEEQEMERAAKARARNLEKQQENWLKQQVAEALPEWDTYTPFMDWKMQRKDYEEDIAWIKTQAVLQHREEEKKRIEEATVRWNALVAQQAAYSVSMLKKEKEEPKPEPNWWDRAKASVNEKLIQPFNTHVYQPVIKPAVDFLNETEAKFNTRFDETVKQPFIQPLVERSKESARIELAWIDEHIKQPVLKPLGESISQGFSNAVTWTNEKVYQPHVKPAIEWAKQDLAYGIDWVDRNVYKPVVQPVVTVFDEKIYKPTIQPKVEKVRDAVENLNDWVNEKIYYPYIEPIESDIKEHIIQPLARKGTEWWSQYGEWVHGALDAVGFIPGVGEVADGINGLLYLAEGNYVAAGLSLMSMIPVVGDMSKLGKWGMKAGQDAIDNVVGATYKAFGGDLAETLAQKSFMEELSEKAAKEASQPLITDEVVEKAVQYSGYIPGAGTVSTTATSLIQLARGKLVDATFTAASMIPIAGDLLTFAKNGVDSSLNRLLRQEALEQATAKTVREVLEAGTATAFREAKEDVVKAVGEESVEKLTREAFEDSTETLSKQAVEVPATKTTKEVFTETINRVRKESREDALIERIPEEDNASKTKEDTKDSIFEKVIVERPQEDTSQAFAEKIAEDNNDVAKAELIKDPIVENTAQVSPEKVNEVEFVNSLREKYGNETVDKFLPFCEKYGINPYDVLTRPPAEGQSLIGWGLDIKDTSNPVNHPVLELNLTQAEIRKIIEKSTIRPESKVIVLGYGTGDKPYFKLSDEIGGCHLSLPNDAWAPFADAQGNFWIDINTPFIENGINERKIFLFNVKSQVIEDPANVRRFSLPEMRLIKMEKNEYVEVAVGEYTALVPRERLDDFAQDIPVELFD